MENNYRWLSVPIGSIKRLVIDGSNLCYKLYCRNGHKWVKGGDYPGFHSTVTAFFDQLRKHGICLDIILDGIDYKEEKTATHRERQEQRFEQIQREQVSRADSEASVLPLFARLVFVDALQDADLPFRIADGEADAEIVAVANFYGCPVLAEDSDFYIFNIKGGYIPLQHFFEVLEGQADVRVYNTTSMAKQFKIQDHDLRLLIPAILGNDFMKGVPYPHLYNSKTIVQSISQCLSVRQFLDSVPDGVDKEKLLENYSQAASLYNDVKLVDNPAEFNEVTSLNVPEWILKRYREGCFAPQMVKAIMTHKCILPVVVDDMRSKCAHYVGLRIRQFTYGILISQQSVTETIRDIGKFGTPPRLTDKVTPCRKLDPVPVSLDMIGHLTITDRIQILCSVLHCCKLVEGQTTNLVDCIPPEWQLVMASCIYWYKKARPTPTHRLLRALIHCLIVCHDGHKASQVQYLAPGSNQDFLETLHAYAQWQSTYGDAVALNQLLMEPFKYVSPAYLYSGEIAMHYAAICYQSETCILTDQDQSKLYDCLMRPFSEMRSKHVTTARTHQKPRVIAKIGRPETFAHPNRFALLQKESHSEQ